MLTFTEHPHLFHRVAVLVSFSRLLEEASHLHVNVNTTPVLALVEQANQWLSKSQKASAKEGTVVRQIRPAQ
jgi:hypothetical protein